jgi:hypothetical protein
MFSRRELLRTVSAGFGYLAFAGMSTLEAKRLLGDDQESAASNNPLAPKQAHFASKAKQVIFLCMQGGPSHLDTFDYKPRLGRDEGKTGRVNGAKLMASPWKFHQRGKSGLWMSELLPELGQHADEMCLIRSMHCDQPIHPRAMTQMHTGNAQFVRPSLGAWTLYGLGTENENLPGFVALNPQATASQNYGNAFLPAIYQGTKVGRPQGPRPGMARNMPSGNGSAIPDINNPRLTRRSQRSQIDFIQQLNQNSLDRAGVDPNVEGVIESYELAFRMQDALPKLMDLSDETQKTLDMYGVNENSTDGFGRQCLMARKFIEAGVRFVELNHGNWDHHQRLREQLPDKCSEIDKPIAGLLADLKQRGLLDQTLVIWGGEFGRTPKIKSITATALPGRDHWGHAQSILLAGGGIQGGRVIGETDKIGGYPISDAQTPENFAATLYEALGLPRETIWKDFTGRPHTLYMGSPIGGLT